ncbi:putative autotransporter adhesin-like protein [Pseudoduganella flava]|uniref:Putative autotransporter adhesin-like protein n=1 Tax=Pseudoduganella flava TaxID=871742 RepID=A0A562PQF2_9BURK|nr:head GIN domain-containing protein [Pseudoduganella flava]TWI46674.1 putative autotransporter adhesin-like protein [Pseudoduganella flava]
MRIATLVKIGLSLFVLALALIGVTYTMLRAQGVANPSSTAGRVTRTEVREIGPGITAIDLQGPIDLTLRQGSAPSLKVRGEQRLLGNVATTQEDGTLHIGTTGMVFHHRRPLQVELVLPSLNAIAIRGSGDSNVSGFSGERLEIVLNGSGGLSFSGRYRRVEAAVHGNGGLDLKAGNGDDVRLALYGSGSISTSGSCNTLSAELTGSGTVDAQHMASNDVTVDVKGSGTAEVFARKSADITIAGSGDVTVYGNPDQRSVNRTGSGSVTWD